MLGETEAGLQELAEVLDESLTATAADSSDEDSANSDSASDDDSADADDESTDESDAMDANAAILTSNVQDAVAAAKADPEASVEVKKASLEDRVALRAKIASEMGKVNPIFYDFHPDGGHTPGQDMKGTALKSQDDLAHVEDIEERHEVMMKVVETQPKVKQAAADIQEAIKTGSITADQVDQLASFGVDPAAVKYWKEFYGDMGSEGKTFAAELVKEHSKAQLEEEMSKYRVKIARAFDLAYQMRDSQIIGTERTSLAKAVDEIMLMNDHGFESMKKVVAQHGPVLAKRASFLPQVTGSSMFSDETTSPVQDLRAQLDAAFATSRPRAF